MDRYTANRYIWLKDQIAAGGSVPQELLDEVAALDTTVNGDETYDPPVVGLVDVVGDLEETVEELDADINGDPTATPPIKGLLERVSDLEPALKFSYTTARTDSGTGNLSADFTTVPSGSMEIVALVPIGVAPETTWGTDAVVFTGVEAISGGYRAKIHAYESTSQAYLIYALLISK